MNGLLGVILPVFVVVSGIPVGSNRPVWWLLWTVLFGAMALAYAGLGMVYARGQRPLQITLYRRWAWIALIVPAYALLQSLPLGAMIPAALIALPDRVAAVMADVPGAFDTISVLPGASALAAVRALGHLMFLWLVIEVTTTPERAEKMGRILMFGLLLHAVWGLVALRVLDDFVLWGEKDDTTYAGALTGTFTGRNAMATFLGFGLVLTTVFFLKKREEIRTAERDRGHAQWLTNDRLGQLGYVALAAIFGLAIALTQSRMGAFASLTGVLVAMSALQYANGRSKRRVLIEVVLGCLVFALALSFAARDTLERAVFLEKNADYRFAIYQFALQMIEMRPLTGWGYDAFGSAFEMFRGDPLSADRIFDLAHNSYLALWVEQGLIVGSIPMVLVLAAGIGLIQRIRRDQGSRAMNAAALGILTLGAVHSLADFSLEIPAVLYAYLLILGIGLGREKLRAPRPEPVVAPQGSPGHEVLTVRT